MSLEDFEHPREVQQRSTQPVDLVDHDALDLPGFNVRDQTPKRGAIHVPARETTVVVLVRHAIPALAGLALDVRLARFPLGVQRIEFLLEPVFR